MSGQLAVCGSSPVLLLPSNAKRTATGRVAVCTSPLAHTSQRLVAARHSSAIFLTGKNRMDIDTNLGGGHNGC